jgi:pyrroloquinoline quinone biosynthesis protein D
MLLGPEVALKLSEPGVAILNLCDGTRSLATISEQLAQEYNAPAEAILADAIDFLAQLTEKGYVRWVQAAS